MWFYGLKKGIFFSFFLAKKIKMNNISIYKEYINRNRELWV